LGGPAAISPTFATGDPRILIGAVPGWEWRDDTDATTPLHLDPRPPGHVLTFAFSPTYAKDGRLFVGAATPKDTDNLQSSTVTVCTAAKCADPTVLTGADGIPTVLPARSFATTGLAYAWTGDRLFRTTDAAKTFKSVTLPAKAAVQAMDEDTDGALYLSLLTTDAKGNPSGGVYVSRDEGKSWTQLGKDTPLAKGSVSISSLGRNRLLAAPEAGGLLCSADAGKTWAKRCPAVTP
jgi:hypothetical protein